MVSKRYEKYNEDIKELIERSTKMEHFSADSVELYSDAHAVLDQVFGRKSPLEEYNVYLSRDRRSTSWRKKDMIPSPNYREVKGEIVSVLRSASRSIEKGYIRNLEFQIANEVFDNVLQESKHFIYEKDPPNKDIGAMLLRIVLEDNLKRICEKEGIETKTKKGYEETPNKLNEKLKEKDFYNSTQESQIRAWLELGNKAHHGKFDEYKIDEVKNFYTGLESFIVNYFK